MLYGMAEPIKRPWSAMGQRVRVYTPFGELLPGMAYLVRRLLENTIQRILLAGRLPRTPARGAVADEPAANGCTANGGRDAATRRQRRRPASRHRVPSPRPSRSATSR